MLKTIESYILEKGSQYPIEFIVILEKVLRWFQEIPNTISGISFLAIKII